MRLFADWLDGLEPLARDAVFALSEYIHETTFERLPPEVVEVTKHFILDTLGVALAGSSAPGCREVVALIEEWGGKPESTVWIYGGRAPAPHAGFLNSVMAHSLDFDETHDDAALHAHVSVLPAALAAGEWVDGRVDGKRLLAAVALGVDVACRLGLALKTPIAFVRTATCGGFGSTAAAANLCGLSAEEVRAALGVYYSQTAGSEQCVIDGGLTKRMQPAFMVKAALLATAMARRGITGSVHTLEGKYGYFNLYERGSYDPAPLTEGLGTKFTNGGISIKPYPCCRCTHGAIDAAIMLHRERPVEPEEVAEITVLTSQMNLDITGAPFRVRENPQVDAQFSIPYTVAVALLRGDVFIADFQEDSIREPRVLDLAKKVRVRVDEDHKRDRLMAPTTVEVRLEGGGLLKKKVEVMKGHPLNPLSWEELTGKFSRCVTFAARPFSGEQTGRIIETVRHLDQLEDVTELVGLLTATDKGLEGVCT
ncbi:MAG: MmgE/PrpD family protein [Nitrospinota bacterium]